MASPAQITVHPSQFPEQVRRDLIESLRSRKINHKFHYDSIKQTQKWLALHEAHSPARKDADCAATYDASFVAAAKSIEAGRVHLIALGCGGGQKDARLLGLLRANSKTVSAIISDVSTAMVLVARGTILAAAPGVECTQLVCDLATAEDLAEVLAAMAGKGTRLVTFFGLIPNFEPDVILPRLAAILRPGDYLLFSANLAPGTDYAAGVRRVLPLYDNDLTREWLMTFLLDLGVERADGELAFAIEDGVNGLKRIVADFEFARPRQIQAEGENFVFKGGEKIRLFYSYRHTPELVCMLLGARGIKVLNQWVTKAGDEGVFLCQKE